jgi:parallel beta-helix repeat protein
LNQPVKAAPQKTPSAPWSVTSNADDANAHDASTIDGFCIDLNGRCTLRAAIEQANAWAGADVITFANGMYIQLNTTVGALPAITEQLRIDASGVWDSVNDQPGVTVNGGNQSFSGLKLMANNCEVYGLFLINFLNGVEIHFSAGNTIGGTLSGQRNVISSNKYVGVSINGSTSHHNVVSGNWIGLGITGDNKAPNQIGVKIEGGAYQNTIGGDSPGKGNVISGNTYNGIYITGSGSDGNRVGANFIGPPAAGFSQIVGNGNSGVYITNGPQNTYVGSSAPDLTGNDIAYNGADGVIIWGANNNWVEKNLILGNKSDGVGVKDSAGNAILSNEISYNKKDGVWVSGASSTGNPIQGNSIHHNGEQGIDLVDGGNTELPAPVILGASANGASGTGCANCTVHLFSDTADEGETYEGFANAGGSGKWSFTGALTGPFVTATNTNAGGNTSEFSAPKIVPSLYLPFIARN